MLRPISSLTAAAFAAMASLAPLTAAPRDGWKLVFSDEFEGNSLDATKWGTTMGFIGTHGPRYHNEYYLSHTEDDDVMVGDGLLHLQTQRRTVKGEEKPGTFHYTQGLVTSHDKFDFTHGYVEIRARFPGGNGLWPCLWLMPRTQGWPPEFDIAEYYAGKRTMHHGLAHGDLYDSKWDSVWDSETDFESDWHVYALEWTRGRAVWLIDGKVRKTIDADYVPNAAMYLILSNSVSSAVGPSGEPDECTVFPNSFSIDYVRVYQPAVTTEVVLNEAAPAVSPALDEPASEGSEEPPPAP
ncbi:MAG: glycoside hydrolase family 16 protein [Chthoniobacteraceae bacterium]